MQIYLKGGIEQMCKYGVAGEGQWKEWKGVSHISNYYAVVAHTYSVTYWECCSI